MIRHKAKRVSVCLKITTGAIGLLGALAWIAAAHGPADDAPYWNCIAAVVTATATFAQAISSLIDWRVPPGATFT